ncbi:MAG TPA: hypothetical protein PLD49_08500 [Thermoclostridium caenicola]|nr:hypothetical protein [Thermoclostridium caenicola]
MEPYAIDMGGYLAWSRYLANNGPAGIYSSYHIVYAPFYLYFLWLSGLIAKAFGLPFHLHIYLIKLWAVIFEAFGAWLIFRMAVRAGRRNAGMVAALCYLMNPGVFMNSSVWGQFDSIPATMLLGVIFLLESGKRNAGALLFLTAVLTKPQSGLLVPIVLYLYFRDFRLDRKGAMRLASGIIAGIGLYLLIVLPFYEPTSLCGTKVPAFLDPFWWLFDLYLKSVQDYPYATANGFNFWTLAGGQIQKDTLPFLGLTYQAWGNILFLFSAVYVFWLLYRARGSGFAVIYGSYLMLFSAFMWITKMHERYLLPAIIFIVLASVFDRMHIPAAILTSLCVFSNQLVIYIISFRKVYWLQRRDPTALCIAAATLITYILAMINGYRCLGKKSPESGKI